MDVPEHIINKMFNTGSDESTYLDWDTAKSKDGFTGNDMGFCRPEGPGGEYARLIGPYLQYQLKKPFYFF